MSGYSSKPLFDKLNFRPGMIVAAIDAPSDYESLLNPPEGFRLHHARGVPDEPVSAVHLFVTERRHLEAGLVRLRATLVPDGLVWVSWPKKASRVETEVTEDVIRSVALPLGFVDIKVCAVSDVWSGLKLVVRRSERSHHR